MVYIEIMIGDKKMINIKNGLIGILLSLGESGLINLTEIRDFCIMYDVVLEKASWTTERGRREPMYFFSDNLGGYTIDAVKWSIMGSSTSLT
jgi:hypothetical protein